MPSAAPYPGSEFTAGGPPRDEFPVGPFAVVLIAMGLFVAAGAFWFLYFDSASQPGGPSCSPATPCSGSPWFAASTRAAELATAQVFALLGSFTLVGGTLWLVSAGRRATRPKSS
jgi:hypothetical protein